MRKRASEMEKGDNTEEGKKRVGYWRIVVKRWKKWRREAW